MEQLLDLKMAGITEPSKEELQHTEGGSILGITAAFVGAAILGNLTLEIIKDGSAQCWEDFKEGYSNAREGRQLWRKKLKI